MSNIAIVYGYGFDDERNSIPMDELEDGLPAGMELMSGYSVGPYSPTAFVIGVQAGDDISMFWPTKLENKLRDVDKEIVDAWELPPKLKEYLVTDATPQFMIYGFSDD